MMNWRHATVLVSLLAFFVILPVLFVQELQSGDETRVAGIAAEMFVENHYLIPYLNGKPFLEYPPLFYWCIAGAYRIFGINEFAAKLPAALAAIGCLWLVFSFCKRLKLQPWTALSGVAMLLTSAQFFDRKSSCTVDLMLTFFLFLSSYAFLAFQQDRKLRYVLLGIAGLAGGVYTKGLLGIVLPVFVLGSWLILLLWQRRRVLWKEGLVLAGEGVAALALVGVWYWMIWVKAGPELFDNAFFVNNIGRFSGSQGDHVESFFYYFKKLPSLFFPWLPVVLLGLWVSRKILWRKGDEHLLLAVLLIVLPFGLFCFASAKRTVYLLPLMPPAAVLAAWTLEHLPESWQKAFYRLLAGVKQPPERLAVYVCTVIVVMGVTIDFIRAAHTNSEDSLRSLFEMCRQIESEGMQVMLRKPAERTSGAAFFYLQHNLKEAPHFLDCPPMNVFWVVRQKDGIPGKNEYGDSHYLIECTRAGDPSDTISPICNPPVLRQ